MPSAQNPIDHALSGALAGCTSTLILHPLDLIKTRMQVKSQTPLRGSFIGTLKEIFSVGKGVSAPFKAFRNVYMGLSANMLGSMSSWGIYFLLYTRFKQSMVSDGSDRSKLTMSQHLIASAEAGLLTVLMTNPIWVLKTRLCTQDIQHRSYKSIFDAAYKIAKNEGITAFYRGMIPAMFGVSHGAIQFAAYEQLKIARYNQRLAAGFSQDKAWALGSLEYVGMAALSKSIATLITYPYQVLKSRMQTSTSTGLEKLRVTSLISSMWHNEGFLGFYRGLFPNLIRVLPGTCITFGVYEAVSTYLQFRRHVYGSELLTLKNQQDDTSEGNEID